MAYTDVINDYTNGATGTITTSNGGTVGYTVTGTATNRDIGTNVGGAGVTLNGEDYFDVHFNNEVSDAVLFMTGSENYEEYFVRIDGVVVDLNTLIANGDLTITSIGTPPIITASGGIAGGTSVYDGSSYELVFHFPITSIGVFGSGGGTSNWDYFEVGINSTTTVICFAQGTAIETDHGPVAIETLGVGDLVMTWGGDVAPIRWISKREITARGLHHNPALCPIRLSAGSLGTGIPKRDLMVSPQHRILASSAVARRMFGQPEVLVAAHRLVGLPGIFVADEVEAVSYYHILLDRHEILVAEGCPAESLYPGPEAMKSIPSTVRKILSAGVPALAGDNGPQPPARMIPKGHCQRQLARRLLKNTRPVLETADLPMG
ncbi:Hint domain-containing protein [Defluviimonas denitrificans]|jgi:hypothetical protein|uniref:Hint domain-containing protein n=1 Tax=Albidovulum denitrificans TaxID=404881 RepID=A0A2S8SCN4_9RHOB|nr:Hint domain-containing protein [Defluviimonas denitrificans]PQV58509.1 Hint domain-containing protein [Defluviimonas denitrificans]